MAKDSRLAEIYRQELKSKGLFSAFISASAERNKEKLDIRNMIPKSGISGAALEKIFGKNNVILKDKEYPIITSSKNKVKIILKQSKNHIIIEPNSNGFDKYLIQDMDVASYYPNLIINNNFVL